METCKHPNKQRYRTEGAAIRALKNMPPHKSRHNYPYRCGDHWHVGRLVKGTFR